MKIDDEDDWDGALERYKPGDKATVRYVQRDIERVAEVAFVEDSTIEVVPLEKVDGSLTRAQRAFRAAWLGEGD